MPSERLEELFRQAIAVADDASMESLFEAGPEAVDRFRALLTGERRIDLPADQQAMDNTMVLSCRLAMRFPDEFLNAFNARRWISSSFILAGLGYTGRNEAKPLLIESLHEDSPATTRLSAAIALASLPGPDSVQALMRVLDDDDYLVKYHAISSLGQIGDRAALERLIAIASDPPSRGIALVAPRAAANLAQRLGIEVEVPQSDMSKWTPLTVEVRREDD